MKPCKKCGVLIDEKSGDLCEECIKIANGAFNTYEKVLKFMSYVVLIGGITYSLIMLTSTSMHRGNIYGSRINAEELIIFFGMISVSIIGWAILSLMVDLSVNIRVLANKGKYV